MPIGAIGVAAVPGRVVSASRPRRRRCASSSHRPPASRSSCRAPIAMWRSRPMARSSSIVPAVATLRNRLNVRGVNELEPRFLPGTTNGRLSVHLPRRPLGRVPRRPEIRKVAVAGGPRRSSAALPVETHAASVGATMIHRLRHRRPTVCSESPPTAVNRCSPTERSEQRETHGTRTCCPAAGRCSSPISRLSDYLGARIEALEVATGTAEADLTAAGCGVHGFRTSGVSRPSAPAADARVDSGIVAGGPFRSRCDVEVIGNGARASRRSAPRRR